MDQLVKEFPQQLDSAIEIGKDAKIRVPENPIQNVYVAGMGGSGIGANFVAELIQPECPVPFLIGKGYGVPGFVGKHTLAIVSSYSGNTEETLQAFEQLVKSGAMIVVVSSGGKLIELARFYGLDFIQVPGGSPSPRACLGYSMVQQLFILNKLELISDKLIREIQMASQLLKKEQDDIRFRAERIAPMLKGKIPVIYTTDRMEAVALRFRQQINENSKSLCWHHVIPEMNHNELVGWREDYNQLAVVYFRNKDDHPRNQVRLDINKEIIGNYTSSIIEVFSKGESLTERMLYFIHLGDWISVYLAYTKGIDAVEIKVIDYLKSELGKV